MTGSPTPFFLSFFSKASIVFRNSIWTAMSNHTTEDELNAFTCHLIQTRMLHLKKRRRRRRPQQQTPQPSSWRQQHGMRLPSSGTTHHKHIIFIKQTCRVAVSALSAEPKQKCLSLLFASKSPDTSACLLTSPATRQREEVEVAEGARGVTGEVRVRRSGGKKSI